MLRNNVKLFNDLVVPYNAALLLKYNCHINVEVVSTIKAVKYLFKYIMKGGTRAAFGFKAVRPEPQEAGDADEELYDEIKHHQDGR